MKRRSRRPDTIWHTSTRRFDYSRSPSTSGPRYMVSHGFFKKGGIADICVRHLGVDGEMTTRELAERVMAERKLDASDRTLRNSVVFKVV